MDEKTLTPETEQPAGEMPRFDPPKAPVPAEEYQEFTIRRPVVRQAVEWRQAEITVEQDDAGNWVFLANGRPNLILGPVRARKLAVQILSDKLPDPEL